MANRYWVGGTANWDGTAGTKWSTTSGGAGGASVPTSADDVFFDAASTGTCTISTGNTGAKSITCTGFTGTLTGTAAIAVSGGITLVAGMTYTYTGTLTLAGTGTLTTAGKTIGALTVNGSGITVTLGDALTSSNQITITQGTFDTANYNVTVPVLSSSNSNTRTITLGSSTVTLSSTSQAINFTTNTNLTFNGGTSSIVLVGAGATITGGATSGIGVTFYNVSTTSTTASTFLVQSINTFNNLTITAPSAAGVTQVTFDSRQTINGTLSTTGTAGNRRVWFRANTYGIAQTLTINSAPSLTDADFRDIYVIGTAAPISGTRVGDLRGCRGITFSTPKSVYWVTAAGGNWSGNNWAASSGGAANTDNFPLAQDTAVIENTGLNTSATVTLDTAVPYTGTVTMSTRTNAVTLNAPSSFAIYGNWVNGSGTTTSGGALVFSGRKTQTITCAGRPTMGAYVDSYEGSLELTDAFIGTSNASIFVINGTFDTKGYAFTALSLNSAYTSVRRIYFRNSTVTLALATSSPIDLTGINLLFDAGTSSVVFSGNNFDNLPFNGGSQTFYDVSFTGTNIYTKIINGDNTFRNLSFSAPASSGLMTFSITGNQTVTGTFTASGATAVRRIFVRSNTLGTARTLTVGTLAADNCDFRDITIAGTAAGSSPTRAGDCGGNSGITFPSPKTVYWNLAGSQNWSATAWASSSGGTPDINEFPLAQDTAVFDDTGSAGTVTTDADWNIGTFDASARTSAMTFSTGTRAPFVYGDWTFGTGVTQTTANATLNFAKRGTQTITSNGVQFNCPVTITSFGGKVQLGDALSVINSFNFTHIAGEFDAVTYNVTIRTYNNTGGQTLRMGSGTWTQTGSGGEVWNAGSLANFYKGTADIVLSNTSTSARTFTGGGLSYNKLTIGGTTGTSTTTITGNNQFTELASTKTVAHTIALGTTTQTFGKWTVTGTAGNVVTLTGTGTSHILAGACTDSIDYLAMGSIGFAATSPGEFYAGANSTGTAGAPVYRTAKPANSTRYWVGGTGNWSDTARWSTSSGGAGGASVPRSHDDVVFDSLSNATAYTATVNAVTGGIRMKSLTIAGPLLGNVTLAGSASVYIHDNVTLPATGLTRTYTGNMVLSSNSTGRTFTTNGVALASAITVNGVDCGWSLGSALNNPGLPITITNGTLNFSSYNAVAQQLASDNGNKRTIEFGSGTHDFVTINFGTTETNRADLIVVAGTAQINISPTSPTFSGNNQTFYNVAFTSTSAGTVTLNGTNSFNNLSFTGITSAGLKNISVTADQTINGTLTLSAGTDATMRHFVRSNTIGTTRTLTCAAVSLTDVDFRDIAIAGAAAPATGTRIGDCKGNSGITFTAAANKYWNLAAGGNWSATGWATSSGGTPDINNFPLAQDTCIFEATGLNSGAAIIMNADYHVGTVDMSARTANTILFLTSNRTISVYGNWINGTGTTVSNNGLLFFAGRGSQTLTSAGVSFASRLEVNSPGGSLTLQDAYQASNTNTGAITLTSGTFNAVTYNVTLGSGGTFTVSGTATRTVAVGSGTWTSSGIGSAWDAITSTNLTVTGTGTISLTSASAKTFAGGSVSYSGITLNQGGAGSMGISGNNTFANITNTYSATGATTINFGTTTQRVGSFTATGEAGRVLTLTGTSASSPAALVLTSGTVTTPDYLTITGIRAYDLNATWYAGANSTNNGSLGWLFQAAGGTTFNASFSDTATGSDAVSASFVFNVSFSDIATGSDAFSAVATLGVAFSDTATGSDAFSAGLLLTAAFSDTATGSDAVSASFAFNASFSDTATGADTVSAGPAFNVSFSDTATGADTVAVAASTFGAALSDTATGADAVSSTGAFNVSLADTATGADAFSAVAALGAAFSDTATGVDAFVAGSAFNAAFSDTATGADSLLAGLSFSAAFSDTATGADAVSTVATLGVEFSDAATGADAVSAAATLNVSFSDTASGLDAPAVAASIFNASFSASAVGQDAPAVAGSTFNVSLSETGAITDVVVGGYLWNPIDDTQSANWQNVVTAQSPGWVQINDAQGPNWVEIQT